MPCSRGSLGIMRIEPESMKLISEIKKTFAKYESKGLFSVEFISGSPEYYSGGRCHSRVIGMIVEALHNLGYITDIERSIKFHKPFIQTNKGKERKMYQFRPDITVVNEKDNVVGIIEYETIDGAEEHLMKKLKYFEHAIPAYPTLEFVLFIPTLTTLKVKPQSWIEMNRMKFVPPIKKEMEMLQKRHPVVDMVFLYLNENGLNI